MHRPSHVWRDKSLWRITTTKTVGGLLTENPSSGSEKKTEELCEMMKKKKHAMEHAKLLQEYEEGQQRDPESENEVNEEVEGKDQELKIKIEGILTPHGIDEWRAEGKRGGQSKKRGWSQYGSGSFSSQRA